MPPSLSVVKCCFLYVPTLTELSRSRLNECIYSQIPTETDGGGWSGISVPLRVQCTVVAAQYGDRSLHVCRSVDNCASLHGTLSHMAVFELTGTAETLNRSSGIDQNELRERHRKMCQLTHKVMTTWSQSYATRAPAGEFWTIGEGGRQTQGPRL